MSADGDTRKRYIEHDNDWRAITDACERRRAQNRVAQRNYRRNIKLRLKRLDRINEAIVSLSQDRGNLGAPQPPSTLSDASNLHTLAPFDTNLSGALDLVAFSPESVLSTEDFQKPLTGSSLSQQESTITVQHNRDIANLESWVNMGSESSFTDSSVSRPSSSSNHIPLSPLQRAVLKGEQSIANILVENGANVHALDGAGNNMLHLAVQSKEPSLVLLALRNNVNIDDTNMMGQTALHMAVEQGAIETIKLLLSAGADTEIKS